MSEKDKQLKVALQEASELLTSYKWSEGHEAMKKVHDLSKDMEGTSLPAFAVDALMNYKKNYYYQTNVEKKAHTAMAKVGHQLADIATAIK